MIVGLLLLLRIEQVNDDDDDDEFDGGNDDLMAETAALSLPPDVIYSPNPVNLADHLNTGWPLLRITFLR